MKASTTFKKAFDSLKGLYHLDRSVLSLVCTLLKMERLKHACFMHVSAHFMRPNPESSMHEICSDNIE